MAAEVEQEVELELQAGRPVHGGAVLATAPDGRRVFLRGTAPGETVRARITADHKTYCWADTIKVLKSSPDRIVGVWPEATAAGIGGLELAHLTPSAQRAWKQEVLAEQIQRIGGPALVEEVQALYPQGVAVETPGDESEGGEGTRTRIQLTGMDGGRLGVKRYRSHDVVPVDRVPVAVSPINDLRAILRDQSGVWKKRWKAGDRVAIEAPSESDAVVVTPKGTFRFADGAPVEPVGMWTVEVDGERRVFEVTSGGFWQAHKLAPSTLATAVVHAAQAKPGQIIFELYSGAGLFSRFLAEAVAPDGRLLTLEGDRRAVANAHHNLTGVAEGVVENYTGKVDPEAIGELVEAADAPVDTIVLDPPRKGAAKGVLAAIGRTAAKRVVLVSCDPAAGARDMRVLLESGFHLESLRAWDLFPHSHHFETVAALVRK